MTIEKLIAKIAELLVVSKAESQLAYNVFLDNLVAALEPEQAIKIKNLGIFKLVTEGGSGTGKIFINFIPESDEDVDSRKSLYLTIEVSGRKKSKDQFDESVFDISVNKPIIPITKDASSGLDTSYYLLKKSIAERTLEVISDSEIFDQFDIWNDYLLTPVKDASEISELEKEELLKPDGDTLEGEPGSEQAENIDDFEVKDDLDIEDIEDFVPGTVIEEQEPLNSGTEQIDDEFEEEMIEDISEPEADDIEKQSDDFEEENNETGEIEDVAETKIAADENSFEQTSNEDKIDPSQEDLEEETEKEILDDGSMDDENLDDEIIIDEEIDVTNESEFEDEEQEVKFVDEHFEEVIEETEQDVEDEIQNLDDNQNEAIEDDILEEAEPESKINLPEEEIEIAEEEEEEIEQIEIAENSVENELELTGDVIEDKPDKEIDKVEISESKEHTKSSSDFSDLDELDNIFTEKKENEPEEEKPNKKKGGKGKLIFWLLLIIILLAGGYYYFFFLKNNSIESGAPVPEERIENINRVNADLPAEIETIEEENSEPAEEERDPIIEKAEVIPEAAEDKPLYIKIKNDTMFSPQIYSSDGKYTVQLSSWKDKTRAENQALSLRNKGHDAFVFEAYVEKFQSTWYRVRVGFFNSKNEAEQFLSSNDL